MNSPRDQLDLTTSIAMAMVATLGTLLLGLGQQSVFLPSIAVLAAVCSVVLTDWLHRFRLDRNIANVAALLAVAYALIDFRSRQDSETQLLAVANLLVYLQIVLQFQAKATRVYWSLSVLSLLQVVVASALNLSVSFGPLLTVYLLFALTGLYLTFIQRETQRFGLADRAEATPAPPPGPRRRWPLAASEANWADSAAENPAAGLMQWRLWPHFAWMFVVTLSVTAIVFFGMPRAQRRVWQSPMMRAPSMVGFSQEVSLGSIGRILQSDEAVMRVVFYRDDSRRPMQFSTEPYFRGATLNSYQQSGGLGRWAQRGERAAIEPLEPPPPGRGTIIQEITLQTTAQPTRTSRRVTLFAMFPTYLDNDSPRSVEIDRASNQLLLPAEEAPEGRQAFRYSLRCGGVRGAQLPRLLRGKPDALDEQIDQLTTNQR
ncbi:MAG: DUF3488 domain-containing protein, partial [Planctomycetales bacterium]|nr:DUF3488 domain-containing protein [Planctomycetales bacterium]